MGTKVGEAEVEIVSVEIQFGVKMPVDVIVKRTTSYGDKGSYDVRSMYDEFSGDYAEDVRNMGNRVFARAIEIVKKFEENEKEAELKRLREHD